MNFYEKEMRMMFGNSNIIHDPHFVGGTMIGKLGGDLRVKIELIWTDTYQKYDAARVTVINRTGGTVDCHAFRFSDIIGKLRNKANDLVDPFIGQYGRSPEWYPTLTVSQKAQIADSILNYVEMYHDQSMVMGEMQM